MAVNARSLRSGALYKTVACTCPLLIALTHELEPWCRIESICDIANLAFQDIIRAEHSIVERLSFRSAMTGRIRKPSTEENRGRAGIGHRQAVRDAGKSTDAVATARSDSCDEEQRFHSRAARYCVGASRTVSTDSLIVHNGIPS